jgi:hypothetical protein
VDLVGSETEKNLLQLSDRKMIGINAVAYFVACHRLIFELGINESTYYHQNLAKLYL